ncbi:hypothetical protein B9Z55_021486 [Caenorhabditis nigoni]|nr:hypothetical protein B9Z55_021486 [Caenorhabditis nigoni]
MMKNLFIVNIFLLISSTVSKNSPDVEQAKFIAQLNQERKKVANQWNITNMHELTWSSELSDIVGTISRKDYQENQSISPYSIMTVETTDYTAMGEG